MEREFEDNRDLRREENTGVLGSVVPPPMKIVARDDQGVMALMMSNSAPSFRKFPPYLHENLGQNIADVGGQAFEIIEIENLTI